MEQLAPSNFFEPSLDWSRRLADKIPEKTSVLHLQKEVSLHLWRIVGTLAHRKLAENTVRCPIVRGELFDEYITKRLMEILPENSDSFLVELATEFRAWLLAKNGSAAFPDGHPIELLMLENHGIDIILRASVFHIE